MKREDVLRVIVWFLGFPLLTTLGLGVFVMFGGTGVVLPVFLLGVAASLGLLVYFLDERVKNRTLEFTVTPCLMAMGLIAFANTLYVLNGESGSKLSWMVYFSLTSIVIWCIYRKRHFIAKEILIIGETISLPGARVNSFLGLYRDDEHHGRSIGLSGMKIGDFHVHPGSVEINVDKLKEKPVLPRVTLINLVDEATEFIRSKIDIAANGQVVISAPDAQDFEIQGVPLHWDGHAVYSFTR